MKKILSFITIALLALTCTACGAKNDPSGISKGEFEQINMGMTIFTRKEIELIDDMTVAPVDMKKKAVAPGIVGYVVRDGDSIWSIAKQYYSSLDSIRKLNSLEGDDVKAGDRLIVVKCAGKN